MRSMFKILAKTIRFNSPCLLAIFIMNHQKDFNEKHSGSCPWMYIYKWLTFGANPIQDGGLRKYKHGYNLSWLRGQIESSLNTLMDQQRRHQDILPRRGRLEYFPGARPGGGACRQTPGGLSLVFWGSSGPSQRKCQEVTAALPVERPVNFGCREGWAAGEGCSMSILGSTD